MISLNYINNGKNGFVTNTIFNEYENSVNNIMESVTESFHNYTTVTSPYFLESEIMGTLGDESALIIEKEQKSFVEKIGAAVIELGKKFAQMIDSLLEKLKDLTFKFKSDEKKLNLLIKEHPEYGKEKIEIMCRDGKLNFSDMKSLAELDKEFEDIVKMAKKSEADPKSLKARWEKAVKKFNESSTAKAVGGAIGLAAATVSLVLLVTTFKSKKADADRSWRENKQKTSKMDADLYECIMSKNSDKIDEDAGKWTWMLAMKRYRDGQVRQAMQEDASLIQRIQNKLAEIADKVDDSGVMKTIKGDTKTNFHAGMKEQLERNREERNANLRSEYRKAQVQQAGRNRSDHRAINNGYGSKAQDARIIANAQEVGRADAKNS